MDFWTSMMKGFLFSLTLCLDLGLVNVILMKTGMERGFAASFRMGFGSCFGDLFYLTLALLGISVVFGNITVRWILWIAGTVFLTYCCIRMVRDSIRPKVVEQTQMKIGAKQTPWKDIAWGIGFTLSSPTLILSFAVLAGPVVAGLRLSHKPVLIGFILGFFLSGLLWSWFVAYFSSRTGKLFGAGMVRLLSLVSAILFLYFAIKVFIDGYVDLLGAI